MAMDVRERERRAITRAIALGLAGEVERVRYGWYRLPSTSRPGTHWTVRVVDGRWSCDCEAGRAGQPCVHQAAVYIAKLERASGARVAGPRVPLEATGEEVLPANVTQLQRRAA